MERDSIFPSTKGSPKPPFGPTCAIINRNSAPFQGRLLAVWHGTVRHRYSEGAAEIDKWHAQRSADILIRLVSDTEYAGLVRSLSVRAPEEGQAVTSFQTGALSSSL